MEEYQDRFRIADFGMRTWDFSLQLTFGFGSGIRILQSAFETRSEI
jgi:hypothetical protein